MVWSRVVSGCEGTALFMSNLDDCAAATSTGGSRYPVGERHSPTDFVSGNGKTSNHEELSRFEDLALSCRHLLRFGKAQQQIAVVRVLLLAQLDFAGQTFVEGVGQGIEFVEDGDDTGLLCE